jgi:hypothetical protein
MEHKLNREWVQRPKVERKDNWYLQSRAEKMHRQALKLSETVLGK